MACCVDSTLRPHSGAVLLSAIVLRKCRSFEHQYARARRLDARSNRRSCAFTLPARADRHVHRIARRDGSRTAAGILGRPSTAPRSFNETGTTSGRPPRHVSPRCSRTSASTCRRMASPDGSSPVRRRTRRRSCRACSSSFSGCATTCFTALNGLSEDSWRISALQHRPDVHHGTAPS